MARDAGIDFGINDLGLLNVYAKDIAHMPLWQRTLWSGFNIAPDGGVCSELLASQGKGTPAKTSAPEALLFKARDELDQALFARYGCRAFRNHDTIKDIVSSCHRFRAIDQHGLFELAKDLTRITADDIDLKGLQKIVPLNLKEKRGSLKSLECVIAKLTDSASAAKSMKTLFIIYELRLADAHLPSMEISNTLEKLGLNISLPMVLQGRDMVNAIVTALYGLARTVQSAPK